MYACLNLTEGDFHSKSDFEVLFQISPEYKLRASSAYRGQAMKSWCEFVHSSFFLLKRKKKRNESTKQNPVQSSISNKQQQEGQAYLRLDVRLSLLQEFRHSHRPVLARPLTAHGPLTEQGHHSFIVGGDLWTKRNGYQPCPMKHPPDGWALRCRPWNI